MEVEIVTNDNNVPCRLCAVSLTPEAARDVFDGDDDRDRKPLNDLISDYLKIEIRIGDDLSSVVCDECHTRILAFDDFAIKCGEAQVQLRFLQNKKSIVSSSQLEDFRIEYNQDDIKEEIDSPIESERCSDSSYAEALEDEPKESRPLRQSRVTSENSFFKFECLFCKELLSTFSCLANHCSKKHKARAKVKCICGKYLYSNRSVTTHFVKHDGSKGIECNVCGKLFLSEKNLKIHSRVHISPEEAPYACDKCPRKYLTKETLKNHKKRHEPQRGRTTYLCPFCDEKFVNKETMRSHIRTEHEYCTPHFCDVCGVAFALESSLENHRSQHENVKIYNCSICSNEFKNEDLLKRHLKRHAEKKNDKLKCPKCPALLSSRRTLRNHMVIHENKSPFSCPLCDRKFKRNKTLKLHINSHTAKESYFCPWCPKKFTNNSNCRIHKKKMHPKELAEYEELHGVTYVLKKVSNEELKNSIESTGQTENPFDDNAIRTIATQTR